MVTVAKSFHIAASALAMNSNGKILMIVDSSYNLYLLDGLTFELLRKIPITAEYPARHPYDHSFSLSQNLDILITSPDDAKASLMRFSDGLKEVKSLDYNDKAVSCSGFSHDGKVLTIGGQDGKTFFYDMKRNQLAGALRTVPDYISSITYSSDSRLVAVSSFDKSTVIYNLECHVVSDRFKLDDFAIERALFVDHDTKIIGLTRHKTLVMYELQTHALSTSVFDVSGWPTEIVAMGPRHAVVSTKGDELYLINHNTFKITKTVALKNSGITQMVMHKYHLCLAFVDGSIDIVNTELYLKEFIAHLHAHEFKQATALIEKNPFLLTQEMISEYDKMWPMIVEKVKQLLFEGKEDEALEWAKPFFIDPHKEVEYNFCAGNAEIFEKLRELIDSKRYLEAHKLCDEYPYLKHAKEYEALDKQWIALFQSCKLLLFKNDTASHASAKAALKPYMAIGSKKVLIDNLTSEYKIFMKADALLHERNFKGYFDLVKLHPFLKSEEMYSRVVQIGNQTYEKLKMYEADEQWDDALKVALYLRDFTPFREKVNVSIDTLNMRKQLMLWIKNNEIAKIYECVGKYKDLESFEPFVRYHDHFRQLEAQGWEHAKAGESGWISKNLAPYVRAAYTMHTVGQIIKKSYLQEFKTACESERSTIDFEKTIKQYGSLFGMDNELFYLARTEKFEDLIKLDDKSGNERGYETKEYPASIIVRKS